MNDNKSIEKLIEASSLGTPEAKALRESVDPALVERVMEQVREAEGRVLTPDEHPNIECQSISSKTAKVCWWCRGEKEQMMDDPKALILPDGTFAGIGGAGQLHDYDQTKPASTAACWYPDSDRTVLGKDWQAPTSEGG